MMDIMVFLKLDKYLPHRCPDNSLQGTVVNRTCLLGNGMSLETTLTVPLNYRLSFFIILINIKLNQMINWSLQIDVFNISFNDIV